MLRYAKISNPGDRSVNEDAVGCFENGDRQCFVLCDGLGGHGMGDAASTLVINVFGDLFLKDINIKDFLGQAFSTAQDCLMSEQIKRRATLKMKTTCVSLVADNKKVYIGHVGDSRLYIFKNDKVLKRTLDHSIPQMLVLSRELKENEIRNHPDRNIILRVMGVDWEEPMYDLMKPISLRKCQAFLLCSDGFWELIDEDDMSELLKHSISPEQWIVTMAEKVKENGKNRNMDNYSAVAVWNM